MNAAAKIAVDTITEQMDLELGCVGIIPDEDYKEALLAIKAKAEDMMAEYRPQFVMGK